MPPYGGRRLVVCLSAERSLVAKLYFPNGGWYFWSRQAYGLGYSCQRETLLDRRMRKARKLSYALGGDGDMDVRPPKPKGMRWKTYERKLAAWGQAATAAETLFGMRCISLVARLQR